MDNLDDKLEKYFSEKSENLKKLNPLWYPAEIFKIYKVKK